MKKMAKEKKHKENKESEKPEEPVKEIPDMEKQTKWILISLAVIIIACIFAFFILKGETKFEYKGINFEKTYQGKLMFYTAKAPAIDSSGEVIGYKEFDFTNDPRKLENIELNTSEGIKFSKDRMIYIAIDDPVQPCEDNALSMVNLARFLSAFSFQVKGAVNNESYKNKNSTIVYANCETNPETTVLRIRNGNETKIVQTAKNCYELVSANCEILKSAEKFQLALLQQYASNFKIVA